LPGQQLQQEERDMSSVSVVAGVFGVLIMVNLLWAMRGW
jgi:hypothetical protein